MSSSSQPPQFFSSPEHRPFKLGTGAVGALLIHGFPGTPAEMRPLGEKLAALGLTVYGFQLPGLGEDIANLSNMNRQKWLAAMRAKWQAIQEDHSQKVLVGYSLGGAIATQLASEQSPNALILLAPFWKSKSWMLRVVPVAKYLFRTVAPFERADFDNQEFRAGLEKMMPGVDLDDEETRQFLRERVKIKSDVIHEILKLGRNTADAAGNLSSPTLIVQGQQDDVVETAVTRRLLTHFSCPVRYAEIAGSHTFPKLEKQTDHKFVTIVKEFLRQEELLQLEAFEGQA